jgi:serine/threonine protein kinase
MVFGYAPFIDDDITTLYQKIIFNEVKFNNKDLDANTQDLIRQLLNKNHQKRIQIREVKNHPFFIGINFEDIEKDEDNILMPVRPLENEDMYIEPELFQQNTHNNSNSSLSTLMFPTIDEFNEPSNAWDII